MKVNTMDYTIAFLQLIDLNKSLPRDMQEFDSVTIYDYGKIFRGTFTRLDPMTKERRSFGVELDSKNIFDYCNYRRKNEGV